VFERGFTKRLAPEGKSYGWRLSQTPATRENSHYFVQIQSNFLTIDQFFGNKGYFNFVLKNKTSQIA